MPRLVPEFCPGCQSRVEPRYSQYRQAGQHLLFVPLLIGGLVLVIALGAYLFWMTARDIVEMLDGLGLRQKERGLLFFLALAVAVPAIGWVARKWWLALDRLPRSFAFECPSCHWTGTVKVKELIGSDEPSSSLRVCIDGESTPADDGLSAQRERRERQRDLTERRQQREQGEEPPNSDFDFTGS